MNGSAPKGYGSRRRLSAADPNTLVTVTVMVRRRQDSAFGSDLEERLLSGNYKPIDRTEAAAQIGADPDDLDVVRSFAKTHGLAVVDENPGSRTIRLASTVQPMNKAFGVQLGWYEDAEGRRYLSHEGAVSIPEELSPIVTAVLGLDQRPIAKPRV